MYRKIRTIDSSIKIIDDKSRRKIQNVTVTVIAR